MPTLTLYVQSKECQKVHWKQTHKAACVGPATKSSRNPGEGPDGSAQTRKVSRWINAWSPAIAKCLPIALDLANHGWGRHETHAYVPSSVDGKFHTADSISKRSLVITIERRAHNDGNGDAQLFRVGLIMNPTHVKFDSLLDMC